MPHLSCISWPINHSLSSSPPLSQRSLLPPLYLARCYYQGVQMDSLSQHWWARSSDFVSIKPILLVYIFDKLFCFFFLIGKRYWCKVEIQRQFAENNIFYAQSADFFSCFLDAFTSTGCKNVFFVTWHSFIKLIINPTPTSQIIALSYL